MTSRSLNAVVLLTTAVLALGACGGGDSSSEAEGDSSASPSAESTPEESTSPTPVQPVVDSAALEQCMLEPNLQRGVYKPIGGDASPEIQQLADDAGGELFRLVRESRALVYAIVLATPEAAEALMPGMQPTLGMVNANLKGPGKPASGNEGPIAFGILPVSAGEDAEALRDSVGGDLASCLEEVGG